MKSRVMLFCLAVLVFVLLATAYVLSSLEKEISSDVHAYEIILYSEEDVRGFRDRYVTFDFPTIKGDTISFYCAEKGCRYSIKHPGKWKVHGVHLDENLQVIKD